MTLRGAAPLLGGADMIEPPTEAWPGDERGAWSRGGRPQPLGPRGPASEGASARMLRVEFRGQPYDWFDLDELGDLVWSDDFAGTLRENIVHYFGVPYDCQAIYDEDGLLSTRLDVTRALHRAQPYFRVHDVRGMPADLCERTARELAASIAEIGRCQRMFGISGPRAENGGGACVAVETAGKALLPVSPWPERRVPSPPRGGGLLQLSPAHGGSLLQLSPAGHLATNGGAAHPERLRVDSAGPARPRPCLEVVLSKPPGGDRFGFANVPAPGVAALAVTWIDPNGLLAQLNQSLPEPSVREGDTILAVNGVGGSTDAMQAQLQLPSVRLLVQRAEPQAGCSLQPCPAPCAQPGALSAAAALPCAIAPGATLPGATLPIATLTHVAQCPASLSPRTTLPGLPGATLVRGAGGPYGLYG